MEKAWFVACAEGGVGKTTLAVDNAAHQDDGKSLLRWLRYAD